MRTTVRWTSTAICLVAGAFAPSTPVAPAPFPESAESHSPNSFHMEVLFPPAPVPVGGTMQLAYELHLTNFAGDTLTLMELQAIDGAEAVVAEFRGTALEALLGRPGPEQPERGRAVAPGARAIVYFNLPVDSTHIPDTLSHRVTFSVTTSKGPENKTVEGGRVEVSKDPLPKLGPPLRGGPWVAVHSPSWERGHRRVFYAIDGRARIQGRFAIDWMRASGPPNAAPDGQGGDPYGLGAEVLAVADGVIAAVRSDVPKPANCADHAPLPPEEHAGNYVALELGDGRYAFYEHLQPGISVRPGDRVRRGQVIGTLGCTGSAVRPHLHFHVGNGPSSFSEGLPYVLTGARVMGVYGSMEEFRAGAAWRSRSPDDGALPDAFFAAPMMVVRFPT